MIPWESTIIPNYLTITAWGWKDTYQGLIVPFLASGFGIFLLRQYFLTIPASSMKLRSLMVVDVPVICGLSCCRCLARH